MRVIEYKAFGDPAEVLVSGERPMPEPGPGEIRVRMTLSPIHNHDLWTIRGSYGVKPPLPAVGGTEAAGVVDALGAGVTNLSVGQRVMAAGLTDTWAEYFLMNAQRAIPLPDSVPDELGCQLVAMPISALMAQLPIIPRLSEPVWGCVAAVFIVRAPALCVQTTASPAVRPMSCSGVVPWWAPRPP